MAMACILNNLHTFQQTAINTNLHNLSLSIDKPDIVDQNIFAGKIFHFLNENLLCQILQWGGGNNLL